MRCSVATAECERAREIDPDKVRLQNRLGVANEVGQEPVQLGKRRRARRAQPAASAVAHTVRFADRELGQCSGVSFPAWKFLPSVGCILT